MAHEAAYVRKTLPLALLISAWLAPLVTAGGASDTIAVSSPVFGQGATMPRRYTGDGADVSPPLTWSTPPKSTKSLALTCLDPDAPRGTWWHWIIFGIPPSSKGLGENVPKSSRVGSSVQGANDFGRLGYNGPAPPPGKTHRYQFRLMALDTLLNLPAGCGKQQFSEAVEGHILAEGTITGVYKR